MDKEQAKELWPIIKAFAEGKQIEIKSKAKGSYWDILEENDMQYIDFKKCDLRIKPEPKYRPFKNAEECFEEMKKHQPFGWVEYKDKKSYTTYCDVNDNCAFNLDFDDYTFVDGEPFGIKEE